MKAALAELLASKKFLTAIVGTIVALGAKFGLQLDDSLVASFVALFASAIVGQGLQDHGSTAAQIKADGPTEVPAVTIAMHGSTSQVVADKVAAAEVKQAGFARLGVMVAIAAIGAALLFGCGGADRQKTLGYALATTTAITADITTQNDALIQADITGRAKSQADGAATLAKYRAARAKVVADMPIVLDAIGAAYQLNDDASLKNAEKALATLLSDVVAMKGAQ